MVPEDSSVILPIGEFPFWINPHNFARRKTMANIKKINRGNALNVIRHITRSCMNYKNQDIDSERTELNTHWNENNAIEEYNKRLKEVFCQNRSDVNTLVGVVISLPKEFADFSIEKQDILFGICIEFLDNKFGEDNSVCAAVHRDEAGEVPHLHYCFVPVVADERRGLKVSAKEVVTRNMLQNFHAELRDYINKITDSNLGNAFYTGVTSKNGGNRSIEELKSEKVYGTIEKELKSLREENKALKNSIEYQSKVIDDLEQENKRLNSLILEKEKEEVFSFSRDDEEFEF